MLVYIPDDAVPRVCRLEPCVSVQKRPDYAPDTKKQLYVALSLGTE